MWRIITHLKARLGSRSHTKGQDCLRLEKPSRTGNGFGLLVSKDGTPSTFTSRVNWQIVWDHNATLGVVCHALEREDKLTGIRGSVIHFNPCLYKGRFIIYRNNATGESSSALFLA